MNSLVRILITCSLGGYLFAQFATWSEAYLLQRKAILNISTVHLPHRGIVMDTGERITREKMVELIGTGQMITDNCGGGYKYLAEAEKEQLFRNCEMVWYRNMGIAALVECVVLYLALKGGARE